eukprot:5504651-Prymnesium_polylepis.1
MRRDGALTERMRGGRDVPAAALAPQRSVLPPSIGGAHGMLHTKFQRSFTSATPRSSRQPMVLAALCVAPVLSFVDHAGLAKEMFAAMDQDKDQHLAYFEMSSILTSPPAQAKGIN